MRNRMRLAVAAGFVGAVAVAATSFAQTGTPAPDREQRKQERPQGDQRSAERRAQARDRCGRGGPHAARLAKRLVHSETKVRVEDGFAVVVADVGKIVSLDDASKTVTIERADGERVTAKADDQTKVCRDGTKTTFEALAVGDNAAVVQGTKDGATRVRSIRAWTKTDQAQATPKTRPAVSDEMLLEEPSA